MLVSLLNPKAIVFFMALFPQFINPQQPFAPSFRYSRVFSVFW
jgi:threonine/homoserine/homoserine lactone efflux protein